MKNAELFLKVWHREEWGIEPALIWPEAQATLTNAEVCELMESYKDYCLRTTVPCGFCGQLSCDCPYVV